MENNEQIIKKEALLGYFINFLEDQKAMDIISYKAPVNWIEDAIIITATSSRHIQSILDKVYMLKVKDEDSIRKMQIDGHALSEWVIISFDAFVLHLFTREKREYYTLDELWAKSSSTAAKVSENV